MSSIIAVSRLRSVLVKEKEKKRVIFKSHLAVSLWSSWILYDRESNFPDFPWLSQDPLATRLSSRRCRLIDYSLVISNAHGKLRSSIARRAISDNECASPFALLRPINPYRHDAIARDEVTLSDVDCYQWIRDDARRWHTLSWYRSSSPANLTSTRAMYIYAACICVPSMHKDVRRHMSRIYNLCVPWSESLLRNQTTKLCLIFSHFHWFMAHVPFTWYALMGSYNPRPDWKDFSRR